MSHLAEALDCEFISLDRPFSSFHFTEAHFHDSAPIRKLFSLSRCRGGRTLIWESVEACSAIEEENEDLKKIAPDYEASPLIRLSFWKSSLQEGDEPQVEDCLGYTLLKRDLIPSRDFDRWHVYEAVFLSYPHAHNYANATAAFEFRCGEKLFSVLGCLYAQQNSLNKTCAQVAIRTIASTYHASNDLSYRAINELATACNPDFVPSDGMSDEEILHVLIALGLNTRYINYSENPTLQTLLPYQKPVYSGIESGCGALLAFSLDGDGTATPDVGHIIPFFGHTFNEDSWAPTGGPSYFQFGETIRYLSSRSWMSSFIVHDDNFGANLCIPQNFLKNRHVSYVFEILPEGYAYSGSEAEVAGSDYFYSLLPSLIPNILGTAAEPWIRRLFNYVNDQRLILRHVPITRERYLQELRELTDWENHQESSEIVDAFESSISCDKLWMVEVSVPEVFPTNKRKLGEILLDASEELSEETDGKNFVLARLPGSFAFLNGFDGQGELLFDFVPSSLTSHVRLFSTLSLS